MSICKTLICQADFAFSEYDMGCEVANRSPWLKRGNDLIAKN